MAPHVGAEKNKKMKGGHTMAENCKKKKSADEKKKKKSAANQLVESFDQPHKFCYVLAKTTASAAVGAGRGIYNAFFGKK